MSDSTLPDDHVLAERIRAGDKVAFGALFKHYWSRLYRFALACVSSPETAEDVVSELFLRLWAARSSFSPSGSIEAYLYGAVRNNVNLSLRTTYRTERRHQDALAKNVVPGMGEGVVEGPGDEYEDETTATLWRVIAQMPELRRMIMHLRWQEQRSYAEIAELLGMSRPAVQMQVDRAIKALRKTLADLPPS